MTFREWLAMNGGDLIGHALTLITLAVGFVAIRHQSRSDINADRTLKFYDRCSDAVTRNSMMMETIRYHLYLLAVSPIDRNAPLRPEIERRSLKVAAMRAELDSFGIFIPPELKPAHQALRHSFEDLNRLASRGGEIEVIERANEKILRAFDAWQRATDTWGGRLGEELGIWKRPTR